MNVEDILLALRKGERMKLDQFECATCGTLAGCIVIMAEDIEPMFLFKHEIKSMDEFHSPKIPEEVD